MVEIPLSGSADTTVSDGKTQTHSILECYQWRTEKADDIKEALNMLDWKETYLEVRSHTCAVTTMRLQISSDQGALQSCTLLLDSATLAWIDQYTETSFYVISWCYHLSTRLDKMQRHNSG